MIINIGDIVEVIPQEGKPWTLDWRERLVVVGINAKRKREYDVSTLDYTLVPVGHPEDGETDGFEADDLRIVTAVKPPPPQPAPVVPVGWRMVPVQMPERSWEAIAFNLCAEFGVDFVAPLGIFARALWHEAVAAAPSSPLPTEAQAGAKALQKMADELAEQSKFQAGFSEHGMATAADICRAEADRLEREGQQ